MMVLFWFLVVVLGGCLIKYIYVQLMWEDKRYRNVKALVASWIVVVFCLGTLIGSIVWTANVSKQRPYVLVQSTQNIVALKDNSTIQGKWFLGTGYVSGNMVYVYQVRVGDSLQMRHLNAYNSGVFLNEVDTNEPRIVWSDWIKPDFYRIMFDEFYPNMYRVDIYAPKGTVDRSFQVDLQ